MSNLSFLPSNVDDLMDMSFNEEFNELVASSEALMDQVAGTEAITSSVDQEVKAARDARVQACNGEKDGGNLDDKLLRIKSCSSLIFWIFIFFLATSFFKKVNSFKVQILMIL